MALSRKQGATQTAAKKLSTAELDALVSADATKMGLCDFLGFELGDAMIELDNLDPNSPGFQQKKGKLQARIRALWAEMRRNNCPLIEG
jgi:hypothetical protein